MKDTLYIGSMEIPSGVKINDYYEVPKTVYKIPITVLNGKQDGKIILITSGIHGGE